MNATDYLLLVLLGGGAVYVAYRLFLGYKVGRLNESKPGESDYSRTPRRENAMADSER
jgi:hypothetical protein